MRPRKIVVKASSAAVSARPGSPDDKPISFGFKATWFALPTDDAHAVSETLGLVDVVPSNWIQGRASAIKREGVFVTPAVGGWTLAVGKLPDMSEAPLLPLLEKLGQRFGEAQYFGNHRVVGYAAWVRAKEGRIHRVYYYLGERGDVVLDRGERTPGEIALGLNLTASEIAASHRQPGEQDVVELAGRWSINPMLVETMKATGQGLFGQLTW